MQKRVSEIFYKKSKEVVRLPQKKMDTENQRMKIHPENIKYQEKEKLVRNVNRE